jgi:hypothetical protein
MLTVSNSIDQLGEPEKRLGYIRGPLINPFAVRAAMAVDKAFISLTVAEHPEALKTFRTIRRTVRVGL